MPEKYGFVYIWRDKKRKMNYIGCHWGTEDDGYVCSSTRMRNAYNRRTLDFRRKILHRVYSNRLELLEIEHQWLKLIPENELGQSYYNQANKHFGHWTATENAAVISKDISNKRKGQNLTFKNSQLRAQRISETKRKKFEEYRQKHGSAISEEWRENNRKANLGKHLSEEHKQHISAGVMNNSVEIRRRGALARVGKRYSIHYCRMCGIDTLSGKDYCAEHAKIHHYQAIAETKRRKKGL